MVKEMQINNDSFKYMSCVTALFFPVTFFLAGCHSSSLAEVTAADTVGAPKPSVTNVTVMLAENEEKEEPDYRAEFLATYDQPFTLDTAFTAGDTAYRLLLRHYCTFDSALLVPAKYNWDTKQAFRTHNFQTEIQLLSGTDTLYARTIQKNLFNPVLESSLKDYAILLEPAVSFIKDTVQLRYSISIPVTDVGTSATIKWDKNGGYQVEK